MTTLTTSIEIARLNAMTATERATELNAGARDIAYVLVDEAAYWLQQGVITGYDLALYLAQCDYANLHKMFYGYKGQHFSNIDLNAVERLIGAIYADIDADAARDAYNEDDKARDAYYEQLERAEAREMAQDAATEAAAAEDAMWAHQYAL